MKITSWVPERDSPLGGQKSKHYNQEEGGIEGTQDGF